MNADLIGPLLKQVSRSFYLTLRVLPAEVRSPISLAYLLARTSDTIADVEIVARAERVELLREMLAVLEGRAPARPFAERLGRAGARPSNPGEAALLERTEDCFAMLAQLQDSDRQRIVDLLRTIISGQLFDLERFPGQPLTAGELDQYTYMVAGCVGEFWTKMCAAHLPGMERLSVADGVRFGKGLQLVNILRDQEKDRKLGRVYAVDYARGLDAAGEHLDAGWRYALAIPESQRRLRLACIWPIWIGWKTLTRLRSEGPGAKVTRGEVYWLMLQSLAFVGNDAMLQEVYDRLRSGR